MLTLDKVYHAAYTLRDVVRKTALIRSPKSTPNATFISSPKICSLQARSRSEARVI